MSVISNMIDSNFLNSYLTEISRSFLKDFNYELNFYYKEKSLKIFPHYKRGPTMYNTETSKRTHCKKEQYKKVEAEKRQEKPKECCKKIEIIEKPVRQECAPKHIITARKACEEIKTVRIGFFNNRQPNESIFPIEKVAGWDISLADYIFREQLGYCVEFYEIPVTNAGLNELTCGLVDVVASSTITIAASINTGAGTIPRLDLANYLITNVAPDLFLAVIYNDNVLGPIACDPATTLRDIWRGIGGFAPGQICPNPSALNFGVNAPGTTQSIIARNALTLAYPTCLAATLDAYFTAHTVNVSAFTCAQLAAGLVNGTYVALLPGPRGDVVQQTVTLNAANALLPGAFSLCPNVGPLIGGANGWAIRSCKLALQAQKALNVAIEDGTYASLIRQAGAFPLFTETCLTAGLGVTAGIPPANNASITAGTISKSCLQCCRHIELLCPCAPAIIRLFPIAGHIVVPTFGDCSTATLTTITQV